MSTFDVPYLRAMASAQRRAARVANFKLIAEAIGQGVAVMIIMASLGLFLYAIEPSQAVVIGNYSPSPSPSEFAKAHAFHGITHSEKVNGVWCFYRNGQRCKLFQEGK